MRTDSQSGRKKDFTFQGGGVSGELFRSIDWSKHGMGPVSGWPSELKTLLKVLFTSYHPMFIFWGPELFQFYNDAYLPSFGIGKHPTAMGQKGEDCWPEIWPVIKPQIDKVMLKGESTWHENQLLPIFRNGKIEDVYWTYGYSPIINEDQNIVGTLVVCTETTKTVIALEEEKNIKDELIDTLESMSDAFFSIDKDWKITRVNDRHTKVTAVEREKQLGQNLLTLFFSDEIYKNSIYWHSYHKAMKERVFVVFEDYYQPLNLWTEVRVYPKSDGGLAIFFTDIGSRKAIESSLATERRKLEIMIDQSPAGVALLRGPQFIFEKVNAEWKQLVGDREYIGLTFAEAYPDIDASLFINALNEVYLTGRTVKMEEIKVLIQSKPGQFEERYYNLSYIRMHDDQGNPYGIFAHTLNVTDRVLSRMRLENEKDLREYEFKHAEQERAKFAAAFQAVADGIFIFDSKGDPVFMNDAAAKVFGSKSAADLMQRVEFYFTNLELRTLNDEPIPLSEWPIAKALRGESFKDWRIKAYRSDIKHSWFWSSSGELATQPGSDITLGVVVLRDITEQVEAENELLKAKHAADVANQTKSAFLANMSHEIRTPLGAILGFTELMNSSTSPAERAEYSETIKRNGRSLTKIIDDILDLSKVEAGRLELEKIVFNVRSLTRDVIDLFADTTLKKGITIHAEFEPKMPKTVNSDPTRIRQILINLIGNAVKFTSKGSVTVRVQPCFAESVLTHVQFSIIDTGLGLTEDQSAKLFEPFSQADHSTTRKFGGSGLGLALSKRLALALGGDVWVANTSFGQGSTFVAKMGATIGGDLPFEFSKKMQAGEKSLQGVDVLLVEDSIDNQMLVKLVLSKNGANVEIASDGLEGVNKALSKDFDIILMDMQMPVLDGYAATERLRNKGYTKPIIALTAHAMEEEKKRTELAGCDAHLTKPLDFELLVRTLLESLGNFNH